MASGDPSRQSRKRLCRFQTYWIDTQDSEYASWLFPDKSNPHKAHCSLCNKTFNIGHGGLNDVKLHCKGKKHFELYCKHRISLGLEVPQLEPAVKSDSSAAQDPPPDTHPPDSDPERLAGECSPPNFLNVEAELSEGGGEIELYNSDDDAEASLLNCEVKLESQEEDLEEEGLEVAAPEEPETLPPPPARKLPLLLPKPSKAMDAVASQPKMTSMTNNADPQQYCLRWKYHHNNLQVMFSQLLERESFCDVTLASEGKLLRAHKVVLSACSTYFDQIFTQYEEKNPIVILKDVKYDDIKALVEFMYRGEINIEQSHLASLLKTAEELKVKGLAEVSWRTDEAQAAAAAAAAAANTSSSSMRLEEEDEPGSKRRKMVSSPAFRPRVTNVMGGVGNISKHGAANFVDISMHEDNGTGLSENFGSDYEIDQHEGMDLEDSMQSNGSYRGVMDMMGGGGIPSEKRASPILDERTRELFKGVVKMNDYLVTGRRQQFWEEPFMRRLMDAIKNKEVEMKLVAEMLGVSYGTLYGRYRDTHGCLKHPYRMRDFWNEPGPSEVIQKLKSKEVTLNEAADMLNVSMNTLTSYVASMPTTFIGPRDTMGESSATAAVFAAARLPPDITVAATAQKQMMKEEHHYEQNGGDGDDDDDDDIIHPQQLLQVQHHQQ
ncbi:uncharacterized protein LOC132202721 isoform X2 [Neocloeon triangulifer]|uniref:uncharacterized protein LOC132202721 isoform X2 n=1 Tax=Neocloeon triangulifer TaxID=2078957 RepID=UPI00286F8CE9|nr:uncharacterized protein LOC132202721 isoform X2 [Neocloeon triangulifer]